MRILLALLLPLGATPALAEPGRLCRGAIQAAERDARLPPHLLMAVARVESWRRDPDTGAFHPWPWTINAEGRGHFFPTKVAAIAAVQHLQAQGVRSIDVGCMQINLRHHPDAFANLDASFDPLTNARYAARFLTELNATRNDWTRAASAYHSQTPEFADPYRARVLAAWAEEQARPHPAVPLLAAAPGTGLGGRAAPLPGIGGGGGQMLSNGAARMDQAAGGGARRGLDAYRSLPVPITGRAPPQVALVTAALTQPAIRPQRLVASR